MPYSSNRGKAWVIAVVERLRPRTILDVGPGAGTYALLLRERLRRLERRTTWIGVEAWAPYVEQFDLLSLYDDIVIADARWVDWPALGRFDLAILGDVLEHMDPHDAASLFARARAAADWVLLSLPVCHYPQGALGGNPFEVHRDHYDHDRVMGTFPGIVDSCVDEQIGVYLASGDPAAATT